MKLNRLLPSNRQWILIVACMAAAVYLHTLGYGFVFDDGAEVTRNTHIRSLTEITKIFSSNAWAGAGFEGVKYRPLTTTSYAVNYYFSGLTPWSYHLFNIALHLLVAILVFRLALHWGLTTAAAGVAAMLFAVHPVNVEVVANVAGRKEALMTVFVLLLLLNHGRGVVRGGWWLVVPPMLYAAALLSKESGAVGLGLVVLRELLSPQPGSRPRRKVVLYASYVAVFLGYFALRWHAVRAFGIPEIPFIDNPAAHQPAVQRILTAVGAVGRGLGHLVAPVTLSPDYSYNAIPVIETLLDVRLLLTLLVLAALAVAAVRLRRRAPTPLLCVCWYLAAILPASNLLFPVGTIFGDRLLYLPSIAFCLAAGFLLVKCARWVNTATVCVFVAAFLVVLAYRTVAYSSAWADELSLFTWATRAVPDSTKAHQKLGDALQAKQRYSEAVMAYKRALSIAPSNYVARSDLAGAFTRTGRLNEAERLFQAVLKAHPRHADSLHGLGNLRRRQGEMKAAVRLWRTALSVDPNHAQCLGDLGTYHYLNGDPGRARQLWTRAVASNPALPTTWYNLGLLYERTGQPIRAKEAWREFLQTAGDGYAQQRVEVQRKLSKR